MWTVRRKSLPLLPLCSTSPIGHFYPGPRCSRVTRDGGTVMLCTLCSATVLSRNYCKDFGNPLTEVMSHSHDGPCVTAPLLTNTVPLTGVQNHPPPLFSYPHGKSLCTASIELKTFLGDPSWTLRLYQAC